MASITSPEQGAQQECSSNFLPFSGNASFSRSILISLYVMTQLLHYRLLTIGKNLDRSQNAVMNKIRYNHPDMTTENKTTPCLLL